MMNAQEIFNHYSHILDKLIGDFNYFKAYFQDPFFMDEDVNKYDLEEYNYTCDLKIACGATRCCLVDNNYPYVVKLNLSESDNISDSCEDEINFYRAAKEWKCQQYLTEVQFLGVYTKEIFFYDIMDIYHKMNYESYFDEDKFNNELQEMIDTENVKRKKIVIQIPLYGYARAEHYSFYGLENVIIRGASPLCERNDNVGRAFVRDWGEEGFETLSNFLSEYNINDLHVGNIGCVNGKIVLIDFGGFHEGNSDY